MAVETMATVFRLERAGTLWRDRGVTYDVVLDGFVVGSVANGEAVAVRIDPGRHRVWLVADGRHSTPAAFDLAPGATAAFRCRPYPKAPAIWPDRTAMPPSRTNGARRLRQTA